MTIDITLKNLNDLHFQVVWKQAQFAPSKILSM